MSTICHCAFPPGGVIECPDDHMAFCTVENGVAHGTCIKPPRYARTRLALANWALDYILDSDERRDVDRPLSSRDQAIITAGRFERLDGSVVSFRLPGTNINPGGTTPLGDPGGGQRRGGAQL